MARLRERSWAMLVSAATVNTRRSSGAERIGGSLGASCANGIPSVGLLGQPSSRLANFENARNAASSWFCVAGDRGVPSTQGRARNASVSTVVDGIAIPRPRQLTKLAKMVP